MHNTLVYCSDHAFLQRNSLHTKYRRWPNGCRKSTQVAERAGSDHSPSVGRVGVSHMLNLQQACNAFVADKLNASVRTRSCACKTMQVGQRLGFPRTASRIPYLQLHTHASYLHPERKPSLWPTCIVLQVPLVLKHRRSNPFASIRSCVFWPPGTIRLQSPLFIASCHRQISQ